jgi:hypothetical protein
MQIARVHTGWRCKNLPEAARDGMSVPHYEAI